MKHETLITLTADIVAAHVANNQVPVTQIEALIGYVGDAIASLGQPVADVEHEAITPKVSIKASIKQDHLVCLKCGDKKRILSRHLSSIHGMTPAQYRERFGLKKDYPMAAPETAAAFRQIALDRGFGGRKRQHEPKAKKAQSRSKSKSG